MPWGHTARTLQAVTSVLVRMGGGGEGKERSVIACFFLPYISIPRNAYTHTSYHTHHTSHITYTPSHTHTHTNTHIHTLTHIHTHTYTPSHIQTYTHSLTHTYSRACTCMHEHTLVACHLTCLLACTGPGPSGCVECKDGFVKENDTCMGTYEGDLCGYV